MTVQADVSPEEVEAAIAAAAAAKAEERDVGEAEDADAEVQSFMAALAAYGNRASAAESSWGSGQFQSALTQYQNLEALLEKHQPKENQPFYYNLYQAWKLRTSISQELIRIEYLESQNKRMRARANAALAKRKAGELRETLATLEGMQSLNDSQKRLRTVCASRCRRTLESVNKKTAAYRGR